MAIRERKVKNKRNSQGILTGRSGIVYDVNVKVYENGRQKSIAKRGFATRREAELYEAQIKLELQTGSAAMVGYGPESKQKLKEYLPKWYESYHHNLAKSTRYSYWSGISIHLIPMLGEVPLNKLTPQMIDDMIAQLREKGLAENSVRYCHRILSSALSSAVKYGYIPNNPAKNIMTRFSKNAGRKYEKYTVEQVQQLLAFVHGNVLETVVLLAVLFGLRLSEALGLRWRDVDLTHRQITLQGQIPCDLPKDAKIVPHLEPLKDRDEGETRSFPITEEALPIFLRLRQEQADQRRLCKLGGVKYYDNDLVVCKPDGSPYLQKRISNIEVTDGNIKSFERTASKYGLDFALKKDVSVEPPSYLVFFKGRDVDVMTAAFKEFSAKTVKQKEQPSIRHKLDQEKAQSKAQHKEKAKVKTKDRGVEL